MNRKQKIEIKFSHDYQKLKAAPDNKATLLDVIDIRVERLSPHFKNYDTDEGKYKLPESGHMLLLIFKGTSGMFTTLRSNWPYGKREFYEKNIGKEFKIVKPESTQNMQLFG